MQAISICRYKYKYIGWDGSYFMWLAISNEGDAYGLLLNKLIWHIQWRKPYRLPGWMKNSYYYTVYTATAGIWTCELQYSTTIGKDTHTVTHEAIQAVSDSIPLANKQSAVVYQESIISNVSGKVSHQFIGEPFQVAFCLKWWSSEVEKYPKNDSHLRDNL